MKSTWSYLLNLVLIVTIVLMFMGIINIHKPLKIINQAQAATPENSAMAYVAINPGGSLVFQNQFHKPMKRCGLGPDTEHKPCEGFGKAKGVVQTIKNISIMSVKGSTCITLISGDGTAYQYCT